MATAAASQVPLSTPVGSDRGVRSSGIKGNNNLSFSNKQWMGATLAWESKAMWPRHANKVLCMSVQQASKTKVAVVPHHLENAKEPPLNTYKPKEPYTATIVSVERLVGPKAPGETCHVVIDHGGNVPYWEAKVTGENPKSLEPHRMSDFTQLHLLDMTASLCVRRAVYYDPETGKEDPSKNGVCSNFLCNSKPGDKIQLTGPSGKIMLLPEDNPNATIS
ncbi:hypothetical protein EJB05_04185 [Eragrostis curvula]|uniref:ferredoxin--NADP(+) reductase n=1 Tax=Eragrostis curvula TaxID=38414 RepID=A0A5J9W9S9_9POAL|nr:hypothetical protein EJB05_04185 [Eragrostis curvula]